MPRPKFLQPKGWTIRIPLLNIKLGGRKKPKKEKEA